MWTESKKYASKRDPKVAFVYTPAICSDFCATTSFPVQSAVATETATTRGTGRDKAPSLRKTIVSKQIRSILFLSSEGGKMLACHSLIANNLNSAPRREMLLVLPIWASWAIQVLLKSCRRAAVGLEIALQCRVWMERGRIGTELATASRYSFMN